MFILIYHHVLYIFISVSTFCPSHNQTQDYLSGSLKCRYLASTAFEMLFLRYIKESLFRSSVALSTTLDKLWQHLYFGQTMATPLWSQNRP